MATNFTPTLVQLATKAIDRLYKKGYRYKRVGVLFKELVPEDQVQQNLFWASDAVGEMALMTVPGQINGPCPEPSRGGARLGCPNCKWQLGRNGRGHGSLRPGGFQPRLATYRESIPTTNQQGEWKALVIPIVIDDWDKTNGEHW